MKEWKGRGKRHVHRNNTRWGTHIIDGVLNIISLQRRKIVCCSDHIRVDRKGAEVKILDTASGWYWRVDQWCDGWFAMINTVTQLRNYSYTPFQYLDPITHARDVTSRQLCWVEIPHCLRPYIHQRVMLAAQAQRKRKQREEGGYDAYLKIKETQHYSTHNSCLHVYPWCMKTLKLTSSRSLRSIWW